MGGVTQLLQNTLYGTALILAAALLRRTLKDRFLPEARLCLWALCLFRLLTPAAPESALSLWGLLPPASASAQPPLYILPEDGFSVSPPLLSSAPQPYAPGPQPAGFPWESVLAAVWLAAGLALAARYVLSWRRTHRAVACAIPIGRDDPRYASLPRCARLREGPMEGAPLTFGAVRPTVVLTPGLSGAELECVLAHEGVHASRRDNLWHYAMALALTVHWWNPAVWLMSRLLRRDIELACDRAAVKKLGPDRRADYAQALVSLATQGGGPAFSHTFGRKLTEERIFAIMKYKKTTALGLALSVLLVGGVAVAFAADPAQPSPDPAPAADEPAGNAGEPAETVGIQVEIFDQSILDAAHDKIEEQMAELMHRVLDEELSGKPAASAQPSACPHLRVINAGRGKIHSSISETAHTVIDLTCKWCVNCEELVVVSRTKTEEDHSFGPDQFVSANHTAADPGGHSFTFTHQCSDCLHGAEYTVPAGCTEGGCMDLSAATGSYAPGTDSYDVKLPTFDEDGSPANSGVIGQKFYDYGFAAGDGSVVGGAVRTSSGSYPLCGGRDCDVPYDHCHIDGGVVRVYYENPGLLCAHPGCDNQELHEHDGVQYAGKAPEAYVILNPDLEPVPSAAPVSSGRHGENHHGSGQH